MRRKIPFQILRELITAKVGRRDGTLGTLSHVAFDPSDEETTDLPTYLLVTFQTLLTILTIENLNFTVFVREVCRLQHLGNMQLSNCSSCFCQV